jgi:3',5'-cyclic AMP phosphodiesterase CpdA
MQYKFDLLLHAGDIAYTSGDQDIWDEYFREMDPTASRVPYMVCPGNHEHYFKFAGYRHRFDMPGRYLSDFDDERRSLWGSYDMGGVHFVAISTEHLKSPVLDEQIAWLRKDLAHAQANRGTVPWIVVYGHRPLYCSTLDGYDCSMKRGMGHIRGLFEPLFTEFGVDLYLTGHLHNYERTWPVFNGTVTTRHYDNVEDTVHVVIGSAGDDEGLTDKWETIPAWSAIREGAHVGYAEIVFVNASSLTFAYRNAASGAVIDTFDLTKLRKEEEVVV